MTHSVSNQAAPYEAKPTAVEQLLRTLEARTTDNVHRRLLVAARSSDPQANMESELAAILEELINED